ncbi:MAG: rhodanese-like domain-containing protein [bacterium]
MFFRLLYDEKLAQACYFIGCQNTGEALVIDPQRDVDRYLHLAAEKGMRVTAIAETHIHADFLSGARELAECTGARLYLSDEGDSDWKYRWLDKKVGGGSYDHQLLKDGDTFNVGRIRFKVVHTPGHTPEHLCYLLTDLGGGATEPMGIASGDFVFVGDVGRPDLLETAAGQKGAKEPAARRLFQSLQQFKQWPDYLQLWPGHGAGSACGKALGAVPQSTVGYEKRFNAAISEASEESLFVRSIIHGQPEPPLYFARMKRENKEGPALLGELPTQKPLTVAEIKSLAQEAVMFVDTRPWSDFVAGHIPGALHAPLNSDFPTVVGSYVEPGIPIYLIVEESQAPEAVIDLIHIGLDEVVGYATLETFSKYAAEGGKLNKTRYMEITDLIAQPMDGTLLLDVRRADEYEVGHLPASLNIAHTRLLAQLHDVPKEKPILVHCLSGVRSAYAAAMLERHGYDATQLEGGYLAWLRAGGETVRE